MIGLAHTTHNSDWCRDHLHSLPASLLQRSDRLVGVCFDQQHPSTMLLWAHSFMCHVDLDKVSAGQCSAVAVAMHTPLSLCAVLCCMCVMLNVLRVLYVCCSLCLM